MKPVTLGARLPGDEGWKHWVESALRTLELASQDTLQNDTSSSGSALATVTGAAADQIAYFTGPTATAFSALTAFGRSVIGLSNAAALLALLAPGVSTILSGTFTLTAGATSTTVTATGCTATSLVFWAPQTAHAANDMATTSAAAGTNQFVLTHANNAQADRTFAYLVLVK